MPNMLQKNFTEVIQLIKRARYNALKAVNTEMINLYSQIGEYISNKIKSKQWGESVVKELSEYLQKNEPTIKGFSDKNLWRMKRFYEIYGNSSKLSPLVREISWTNNLIIFSRANSPEEREFYLKLCIKEKYSKRELERQIDSSVFERAMIGNHKLPNTIKSSHPNSHNLFKDNYILDFIDLPKEYNESDLQKGLVTSMKNFILELGRDFLFIGEEYRLQVGSNDFYLDLLFFHRELQCLVAFELKTTKFKPDHLGQLNFYLEALDRDVKKPHENPSIGILLCKDKDDEVVEYALSRALSPALVAKYNTKLPDKKLLQQKLHELF